MKNFINFSIVGSLMTMIFFRNRQLYDITSGDLVYLPVLTSFAMAHYFIFHV